MSSLHRVYIEKLIYGGYGLSQLGGKKLMVEYALPGEKVEVELIQEKKDYSIGKVIKVLEASQDRRDAPCVYYGVCGGCQLQHMSYKSQLKTKEEMLLETLERIGKLQINKLEDPLYGEEFGYRIKVQFKASQGRIGFYERRSHNLVEIEECLLLHPSINQTLPSLRELTKRLKSLQEIEVIYSPTEDEFLLKLLSSEEIPKEKLRKVVEDTLPKKVVGVGIYRENKLYHIGRDFIFVKVDPFLYRLSMDSFIQVNYKLWEDFVKAAVPQNSFNKVLELHCGIGFFTLPLVKRSSFVNAYDSNGRAIKDAEYNAKINSISNVSFQQEKSSIALKKHAGDIFDLIFLDPPRSGLSEGEAQLILKNRPKSIVYVSCEPTTLARDLKVLIKGGYKLLSLRMVDNFPNTYHIEAVAHLEVI
ncbi:MAG: 23S rRNA (uracil(1939)-C(5))-methyltransferase RlmD [Aquificaceae bacterium]